MAFTPAEEDIIREIIVAYENGREIPELPPLTNPNVFNLLIEVSESGESKYGYLADLIPYISDQTSYGVEVDVTVAGSGFTRIGNPALHRSLPIQNRMRSCIMSEAGDIIEYLNPSDWSGYVLDGSRGQVMIELPAHYRRYEVEGNIIRCRISEYEIPGFFMMPQMYISAFEASYRRSDGVLCSVVNQTEDYRGGDNTADWDNTYRSLLGRPVSNLSRTALRDGARLRGAGSNPAWNCFDYNVYNSLVWLYFIEYADRNSQLPFNAQKDSNGYSQGGIGMGVTNMVNWVDYNNANPFVPCGHTNTLANGSGEVPYEVLDDTGATLVTVYANRYRGIENPFGHLWNWSDGINMQIASDADGGMSQVFICNDQTEYNDDNNNGYYMRGLASRTSGFISNIIFGNEGDLIASEVGGSSSTRWTDYYYTTIPGSGTYLYGVLFGGNSNSYTNGGLMTTTTVSVPGRAATDIGSRLCYIPQE